VLSVSTAGGFGTLFVSGDLISGGNIVTDGNVVATAGIIAGDQIAAGGGIVANGVQDASRDPAAVRSLTASIKTDTDAVNKAITAYATAAKSSIDAIAAFENAAVPMSSQVFATLGFSFPQSADYGLPGNFKYGLPEMRWQQRSPSQEPWVENTVGTPAGDAESAAYPGYDIWFGSGEYLRAPKGLYFDITTGLSTLSQVSTNSASDPGSVVSVPAPTPLQDFVRS
jgi:hypothetical protein